MMARLCEAARGGVAGETVVPAVMMLCSDQRVGDAERALALSVAGYLIKPVKRTALLAAVAGALGAAPTASTGTLSARHRRRARLGPGRGGARAGAGRLLLVDDSVDNRRLVELYLKSLPYVLDTAADGREGLAAFRRGRYDLVLMDVHMPVLDGLEATRAIRAWEGERGQPPTPVVALTASAMPEDVRQTLAAGCDAHVPKPVKKQALVETIERYVRGGREGPPAVTAGP